MSTNEDQAEDVPVAIAEVEASEPPKKSKQKHHDAKIISAAAVAYCSDPECATIAKMATHPKFKHIPFSTLARWRRKYDWDGLRQQFHLDWIERVKKSFGKREARKREIEIRQLSRLQAKANKHLLGKNAVLPKSWEGVLKMRVDIGKRIEELTKLQAEDFFPEKESTESQVPLSAEERRIVERHRADVAEKLLETRRTEMRQQLGSGAPALSSAAEEPQPKTAAEPAATDATPEPSEIVPAKIAPPRIQVATPDRS